MRQCNTYRSNGNYSDDKGTQAETIVQDVSGTLQGTIRSQPLNMLQWGALNWRRPWNAESLGYSEPGGDLSCDVGGGGGECAPSKTSFGGPRKWDWSGRG